MFSLCFSIFLSFAIHHLSPTAKLYPYAIYINAAKYFFPLKNDVVDSQVQIHLNIPHHDMLREMKLELLQQHPTPTIKDAIGFNCSEDTFIIKLVLMLNSLTFSLMTN